MNKKIEQIYKENYERLFALAFRVTGEQYAAEDILQEAFYNAIKSWGKFEKRSSYYTWLYRIVLNGALKYIKEAKALPVDIYAEEHGMSIDSVYEYINTYNEMPDDSVVVSQVRETCLQMFLNCLPPEYRIVYTLRVILNCSVKESAEILDISENSVKIRLSRAKKLLKNHMEGRCSLISKNGKCNCRTFASHVVETNKIGTMINPDIIKKHEHEAGLMFNSAIKEIIEVDDLYNTDTFKPISFNELKRNVIKLYKNGENSLLS